MISRGRHSILTLETSSDMGVAAPFFASGLVMYGAARNIILLCLLWHAREKERVMNEPFISLDGV
jgi:hypothetical protein